MEDNYPAKMPIKRNISGINLPAALITIMVIILLVAWSLIAERKSSDRPPANQPTAVSDIKPKSD